MCLSIPVLVGLATGTFIGNFKTAVDIYDRARRPKIAIDWNLQGARSGQPNVLVPGLARPLGIGLAPATMKGLDLARPRHPDPPITQEPLTPKAYLFGGEHWFDWGSTVAVGRSLLFRHP